ncbi:hypothetical protein ALC60_04409 [Trachymyrmex zeteki]|uniref:C2H2-type domain-containing protein n=1 Tax=Mycetomoellerius zeteki TaxID=64791 RepID=A0A151X904_9HYME|nr:PREDICTED: uncharacterized protein LOC108721514 [Trachymyrmex zeteki]KYQ56809.1 hypothetical protein ALC60_04409 [Trachymyrmex zeteki]
MNACQEVVSSTAKLLDVSKYNLRCNRNISEKMTKKDFIYDIPTPMQTVRKFETQRQPIILLRRKDIGTKMPHYTVISEKRMDSGGSGDAAVVADRRILRYSCNLCQEPMATLFSLSTHVKFHCQRYCKICYWILRENETMERHIGNYHRTVPEIASF